MQKKDNTDYQIFIFLGKCVCTVDFHIFALNITTMQGDRNQRNYRNRRQPKERGKGRPKNTIKHSNYSIRIPDVWLDSLRDYANSRNVSTNALVISIMRYTIGKYLFSKVYYHVDTKYSVQRNEWTGSGRTICPYCRTIHTIPWGTHPVRDIITCTCERSFKYAFPLTDYINTKPIDIDIEGWEKLSGEPHVTWDASNYDQL